MGDECSIPYLVVMRERVVLFAQAGALPPEALESIIQQTRALDMKKVHEEVAAQQDSAVARQDTATAK